MTYFLIKYSNRDNYIEPIDTSHGVKLLALFFHCPIPDICHALGWKGDARSQFLLFDVLLFYRIKAMLARRIIVMSNKVK